MSKNILVAYFSASGVTKAVAEKVAEACHGDLFEIIPVTAYTKADLDWTDKQSRSSVEMNNQSFRPPVSNKIDDINKYDTVLIGFPIWWYIAPTIINTFLESYDFSGKTIIPFATSGGSGFGETVNKLKPSCSDKAIWKNGKLLNRATGKEINEWTKQFTD